MKSKNIINVIIVVVIVGLLAYFSVCGLKIGDKTIIKGIKELKTGLDISGGVSIVYQAKVEDGKDITEEDLKKSEAVIRNRLEAKNIFDYIVRSDISTKQISVEIPAKITDSSQDPLEVVEGLDKTAKIEFRDQDSNVLLSGDDIESATYSSDPTDNTGMPSPHVVLTFSEEGKKKFADATEKLAGSTLPIYLDEEKITEPYVTEKIESNTAISTMCSSDSYEHRAQEARNIAMLIDSGALPFSLEVVHKEYIGPYIGQKALEVSMMAGLVALIVIAVMMIVIYRLPGFVSAVALVGYTALVLLVMSTTGISLTLPGIASLILSIGMAVDANVIIFERYKEELRAKSRNAFEKSFKHAMSAIVDGNITTFIVGILLYIFGIGTVKGFGIVLALGVILSLFTAVIVTKFLLKQFVPLENKHPFLFGIKKEVTK